MTTKATWSRHDARYAGARRGFTLLEIMVAIAILAITLVVLLSIVTNNIRATNHAKMTTAATFLARTKMVDIEDQILDVGFSDTTETAVGTFKELGYPQFRWETTIERIELPADMGQRAKDQATDDTKDAKDPMSMLTGIMGSMMSSFIEPVRIGLQESVRKVTVRVIWNEHGRPRSELRGRAVPDRPGQGRHQQLRRRRGQRHRRRERRQRNGRGQRGGEPDERAQGAGALMRASHSSATRPAPRASR